MKEEPNNISEDDPVLERDYQELAQWLIDVYLWRLTEERRKRGDQPVDKE